MKKRNKKLLQYADEVILTYCMLAITMLAGVAFVVGASFTFFHELFQKNLMVTSEETIFILIVLFLIYGNILYQYTRIGYFKRLLDKSLLQKEESSNLLSSESFMAQ